MTHHDNNCLPRRFALLLPLPPVTGLLRGQLDSEGNRKDDFHLQGTQKAASLSTDVDAARAKNQHTFESLSTFDEKGAGEPRDYTLPSIWDKLDESSSFTERTLTVKEFNNSNEWKKRGISRLPILMDVKLKPAPGRVSILRDGSVVEVGGIELGQGLWTKGEITAGIEYHIRA